MSLTILTLGLDTGSIFSFKNSLVGFGQSLGWGMCTNEYSCEWYCPWNNQDSFQQYSMSFYISTTKYLRLLFEMSLKLTSHSGVRYCMKRPSYSLFFVYAIPLFVFAASFDGATNTTLQQEIFTGVVDIYKILPMSPL